MLSFIVRQRRPSLFSKDFSKTAAPISIKFHLQYPGNGGMKISSKGPGHMNKLTAFRIY